MSSIIRADRWQNSNGVAYNSVLQVVSTTKTDTWSATVAIGTTTAVTGFTATITPLFSTSKILVIVDAQITQSNNQNIKAILTRGGSAINAATGDAASNRTRISSMATGSSTTGYSQASFSYLDSPATTSAITYGLIVGHTNTNGADNNIMYLNRSHSDTDSAQNGYRAASTITLMEIAQ